MTRRHAGPAAGGEDGSASHGRAGPGRGRGVDPEALREWAAGRAARESRRALVLAGWLEEGDTGGYSPSTLYRWAAAVREEGPGALAERARTGRPARQPAADAAVASLLAAAGSRVVWRGYSSRGLAEVTRLPQSLVTRSVRALAGTPAGEVPASATRAVRAVHVDRGVQVLLRDAAPARTSSTAARSRRIAAVFAALHMAGFGEAVHPPAPAATPVAPTGGEDVVVSWQPGEDWTSFRAQLQSLLWGSQDVPGPLLDALAGAVHTRLVNFDWVASAASPAAGRLARVAEVGGARGASGESRGPRETSDSYELSAFWVPPEDVSLTERVAAGLRAEIVESGYRPGDSFSPARLARDFGLPRATVEAAILRLGDEGVLDAQLRIPQIGPTDVVDLYAARLGLGSMILRNYVGRGARDLVRVRRAVERVVALAGAGERSTVAEADLRFQQELARSSGLSQTGRTFENLTLRLRMFISILRLDYAPAVERIVRDDRLIMVHLLEGHPEDAVRVWRGKLDHAVRHMISRLERPRFDSELWQRLTN